MKIDIETLAQCKPVCPYFEVEAVRLFANDKVCSVYFKCKNVDMCKQLKQAMEDNANGDKANTRAE